MDTHYWTRMLLGSILLIFHHVGAQSLEIPQTFAHETLTSHTAYTTSYYHRYGQPHWVAYQLFPSRLVSVAQRPARFSPDPKISPSTTAHEAYTKTGFDRGHLAPAADMAWSVQTMNESFYTSNICPQRPSFNRGIWKNLETQVRNWAAKPNKSGKMPHLFIVTGPVFTENMINLSRNTKDTLAVPEYFFKAILDTAGTYRAIGFLIPNQKFEAATLMSFAMSIDELELKIGRDVFPELPDDLEAKIESAFRHKDWN
jgi:endonuclease G, mitochondrial